MALAIGNAITLDHMGTPSVVVHTEKLFIGELRREAPATVIKALLEELIPSASQIEIYGEPNSDPPRNRGFAFAHFASHDEAGKARTFCRSQKPKILGRPISCDWAQVENVVSDEIMQKVTVLFVRNIHPKVTEDQLKEHFGGAAGGVTKVKIQKSYAFVHFDSRERAEEKKNTMDGRMLNNCRLEVQWSKPQRILRDRLMPPPMNTHYCGAAPYTIPTSIRPQPPSLLPQLQLAQCIQRPAAPTNPFEGFSLYPIECVPPPVPLTAALVSTVDIHTRPAWQLCLKMCHRTGLQPPSVSTTIHVTQFAMHVSSVFRSTAHYNNAFRVEGELRYSQAEAEDSALRCMTAMLENIPPVHLY